MRSLISIKEGFVFYSECVKGLGGAEAPHTKSETDCAQEQLPLQ